MSKPTKAKRRVLYEAMLKILENVGKNETITIKGTTFEFNDTPDVIEDCEVTNKEGYLRTIPIFGFCSIVILLRITTPYFGMVFYEDLKELLAKKPQWDGVKAYWFPAKDRAPRIAILKEILSEMS